MRSVWNTLYLCLILTITPAWGSLPSVELTPGRDSFSLEGALLYWRQTPSITTIEALLQGDSDVQWQPLGEATPNFGFDAHPYWYRFELHNPRKVRAEIILEIDYPVLDHVDFYLLRSNSIIDHFTFGDKIPFDLRRIKHHNFIIPLELEPDETLTLISRVQTNGSHQLPMALWEEEAFYEHNARTMMGQGVYFGIMMVMAVYNLFIFIAVRDRSYFYYVLTVVSFGLFQAGLHGFTFQFLWPNGINFNDTAIAMSISVFGLSGVMFVISFLNVKQHAPRLYRVLLVYAWLNVSALFCVFLLPYEYSIKFSSVMGVPGNLLALGSGIYLYLQGHRHTRYYIAGWSFFLAATFTLSLNKFGILPLNFITEYSAQIGSMLEVIVFSFALADRINTIRADKETFERKSKAALLEANQSLGESIRLKDEFLATISHELRTPMNGVLGCLEHLQDPPTPTGEVSYRSAAQRSARDMMQLVERILDYTEVQSGQLMLKPQPFSLHVICNALAASTAEKARSKGLRFMVALDESLPARIEADPDRLSQVLEALLDNAVKFTREGGLHLQVSLLSLDDASHATLRFVVEDSGPGIPAEAEKHIFERFRQLDGSFQRGSGGLGIGLTLCQSLVNCMGGQLTYEAVKTGGSRFTFTLTFPCDNSAPNVTTPAAPAHVSTLCAESAFWWLKTILSTRW